MKEEMEKIVDFAEFALQSGKLGDLAVYRSVVEAIHKVAFESLYGEKKLFTEFKADK